MASHYCIVTTTAQTDPNGNIIPVGSAVQIVMVDDPADFDPAVSHGAGYGLVQWTGQTVWQPPAAAPPVPTTLPALTFLRRFTRVTQAAVFAANPLWALQIAAAGTIDVTDPTLLADIAAAVSAGLLTQAEADRALDLSQASP